MEKMADEGMHPPKSGFASTTVKPLDIVVAQYDYNPTKRAQLRFFSGDIIYVLSKNESGWWDGIIYHSKNSVHRGWFPRSYVKSIKDTNSSRKIFSLSHYGNRPSSNGSRRNSLRVTSPSGNNMNNRSASGSRRGSLASAGNFRRKSLSSTAFQDIHDTTFQNAHNIFSTSPANSKDSMHTGGSSHLKQDYQFDMNYRSASRSRKPSIASSSKSSSSAKSSNFQARSVDSLHNGCLPSEHSNSKRSVSSTRSHPLYESEINILSAKEVEMLFNNMSKQEFVPVWTPVLTVNNNLLYFNKELNIYCTSLPLLKSPELTLKSVFAPNEHLVDLQVRDFDSDSSTNTQMMELESVSSNQLRNQTSNPMVVVGTNTPQRPNFQSTASKDAATQSSDIAGQSPNLAPHTNQSVNHQESEGRFLNPTLRSTLPSSKEIFYSLESDLKTWTELKNITLYYLKTAHNFFFKQNKPSFYQNFSSATTYIFYHQLACKLLRKELIRKNVIKDVRKIIKKLIKALFRINVNVSFYFNSHRRIVVNPSDGKRISSETHIFNNDCFTESSGRSSGFIIPSNIEFPDLRNISTSTTTSLNRNSTMDYTSDTGNRTSETIQLDIDSPRTSVPTNATQTSNMLIDEETGIVLNSLFNVIQTDFTNIFKLIGNLHTIILQSVATDDVLVQIHPRFFKNSYEGTIWTRTDAKTPSHASGLLSHGSPSFELNSLNPPTLPESLSNSIFSGRQYSSSSARTAHSVLEKQNSTGSISKMQQKSRSRTKEAHSHRYPLNYSTLNLIREKLTLINNFSKSEKRATGTSLSSVDLVELSMATYTGLKDSAAFLNMVDSLDLQFFLNLKRCASDKTLEKELHEFCESSMTNVVSLLLEYYDLKQALHDITIRYVMDTQNLSLRDPFVFCSMRGELSQSSKDNNIDLYQLIESQKKVNVLYEQLLSQDVEVNGMSFIKTQEVLHEAALRYHNIASLIFAIIEQLIVERENIINYAARMMNNEFMEVLLKDEQFEYDDVVSTSITASQTASDDQEFKQQGRPTSMLSSTMDSKASTSSPQSFMDDILWFLDSDYEYELIYSPNGHIKGGTKDALIEHLTNHKTIDAFFNIVMLTTFRSMFTTAEFMRYLFRRFDISPPEGLSYEEYNVWVEKKQKPIRARVINIIKSWLTDYWNDCYYEDSLDSFEELKNIVNLAILEDFSGAHELKPIVEERISTIEVKLQHSDHNSINSPPPQVAKSPTPKSSNFRIRKHRLLEFDPFTFAQQLTLNEHILYSAIDQFECLDRIWHKKHANFGGSANISKFITSSNRLTDFVSYSIVKEADGKKRAAVLQFFIQVSEQCYNLKNFSSMTAIVSALYSSPIFRLKKTFERLPKHVLNSLDKLNTLMDSTKNFFRYRELLKTVHDVPCVPFFGVYLSDLTFTASGNPDFLNNNPEIINFSKRLKIVTILNEIMSFQKITYKLKHSDDVNAFLESDMNNIPSIEKQYELSLKIEPRADVSSNFNNAEYQTTTDMNKTSSKRLRFGRLRK